MQWSIARKMRYYTELVYGIQFPTIFTIFCPNMGGNYTVEIHTAIGRVFFRESHGVDCEKMTGRPYPLVNIQKAGNCHFNG
jgi:hypothetical protein